MGGEGTQWGKTQSSAKTFKHSEKQSARTTGTGGICTKRAIVGTMYTNRLCYTLSLKGGPTVLNTLEEQRARAHVQPQQQQNELIKEN